MTNSKVTAVHYVRLFLFDNRIDDKFLIKVGDFGLSEDVYCTNYFRQGEDASVKLPFKWMALESLLDGIFSEKTDVVSMLQAF